MSREAIVEFAGRVGIHPGIVVGRLQHDGRLPWTHFRNLLAGVRTAILGAAERETSLKTMRPTRGAKR